MQRGGTVGSGRWGLGGQSRVREGGAGLGMEGLCGCSPPLSCSGAIIVLQASPEGTIETLNPALIPLLHAVAH